MTASQDYFLLANNVCSVYSFQSKSKQLYRRFKLWELLTWQNLREFCVNVTDSCHLPPCHLRGMDLCHMTRQEIEALLKVLAEMEREELELLMLERREAEREGRLH